MIDEINKEFEQFQADLQIRNKNLKFINTFEVGNELDLILNDLKVKEITL